MRVSGEFALSRGEGPIRTPGLRSAVALVAGMLAVAAGGAAAVSPAAEVNPFFRDASTSTSGSRRELMQITSPTDLGALVYTLRLTLPDLSRLPLPANTGLGFSSSASIDGPNVAGSFMRASFRLRRAARAGTETLGHGNDRISSTRGSTFGSSDVPADLAPGDSIEVVFRFTSDARLRKGHTVTFSADWSITTEDPEFQRNGPTHRAAASLVADTTTVGGRVSALMRTRHKGSFAGFERVVRSPIPALPVGLDYQTFSAILSVTNFTIEEARLVVTVVRRPASGQREILGKYLIKSSPFTIRLERKVLELPAGMGSGDDLEFHVRVRSGGAARKDRLFGFSGSWSLTDAVDES